MRNRLGLERLRELTGSPRGIVTAGAFLVVLALLLDSAGLAIFIAALVVPIAVLIDLSKRDLFEVEPWWATLGVAAMGAIAAIFVTLINVLLLKQFETETDPYNTCCGIFYGRVNLDIKSAGGLSIITVGFLLPLIAEVLKAAGPVYLRQQPRFRNEVMDGLTLGAAAGGGYAAAAAILYFWPLVNGASDLGGSVSGWTSALIALLIVRPLISCATTGLICAGIWHFGLSPRTNNLLIPVTSALVGSVILAIGTLIIADQATVVELIWNAVVMVALLAVSRYVLTTSLKQDALPLAADGSRVICPNCGSLTKPGAFCANCGASLTVPSVPTEASQPETELVTEPIEHLEPIISNPEVQDKDETEPLPPEEQKKPPF